MDGEGEVKVVKTYGDLWTKIQLILEYGPVCFYCERSFRPSVEGWFLMTVDHLDPKKKPKNKGEPDVFGNLRLACKSCNSSKGRRGFEPEIEDLGAFQREMREGQKISDRWYEAQICKLKHLRACGKKASDAGTPEELAGALIRVLGSLPGFDTVRRDSRRSDSVRFDTGGRQWRFRGDCFLLEAWFIDNRKHEHLRPELENLGFYFGWAARGRKPYKNLPLFIDADEGAKLIKSEVQAVEKVLAAAGSNA